jgi:hypothetical protein
MIVNLTFSDSFARALVATVAGRYKIEPALVAAIVMQESGGNPWAWNPEPRYQWFWDVRLGKAFRTVTPGEVAAKFPPADFHSLAGDADQEWWGQQASWGLMQVMGAVARERGFRGPYLPALSDPTEGLEYGCRHLAYLQSRYAGGAISAYNAGSPKPGSDYEKSVLAKRETLRPLFT